MRIFLMVLVFLGSFSLSGCIEVNKYYPTEPVEAKLVLPAFDPATIVLSTTTSVEYMQAITVVPPTGVNVCDDVMWTIVGSSIQESARICERYPDGSTRIATSFHTRAPGESRITLTPKSNPKGATTLRIIVNEKG